MGLSNCCCELTYFSFPENKVFKETKPFIIPNGSTKYGMFFPKKKLTREEKWNLKHTSSKKHICQVCGNICNHLTFMKV